MKYWRCKMCGAVVNKEFCVKCAINGDVANAVEPVEVWPEGTVAKLQEVLCKAAPLGWVYHSDGDAAKAWEKEVEALLPKTATEAPR